MTTVHELHSFYSGDDWQINGTLFNAQGDPLDITNATIEWVLMNTLQQVVVPDTAIQLEVVDAVNGKISILIKSATTTGVAPGQYNDMLRVTIGTISDTMWTGGIAVKKGLP